MNTLVSLPILAATPTTAPAMPHDLDPIFAALDNWRRAQAAADAVPDDEDYDEAGVGYWSACVAVMRTRPTSPAGLAALTGWLREQVPILQGLAHAELLELLATLDDAARGMSGLQPWSPPTAFALPTAGDQSLVDAAERMLAVDDEINQLHLTYGDDADSRDDYNALNVDRNEQIAVLIDVPATSATGIGAKAAAVRWRRFVEDYEQHQQVAVSLADDIARIGSAAMTERLSVADAGISMLGRQYEDLLRQYVEAKIRWRAAGKNSAAYQEADEEMCQLSDRMYPLQEQIQCYAGNSAEAMRANALVALRHAMPIRHDGSVIAETEGDLQDLLFVALEFTGLAAYAYEIQDRCEAAIKSRGVDVS